VSYQDLKNIFPHAMVLPKKEADAIVRLLLSENRTDVTNGSSFAVTVDGGYGGIFWTLWLSVTSYAYLRTFDVEDA
jgi:hypothetical protein